MKDQSAPMLDQGLSALFDDLDPRPAREPSSSPSVNSAAVPKWASRPAATTTAPTVATTGPTATPAVIGGAGIKRGYVHGKSDKTGSATGRGRRTTIPTEILATIYHAMPNGIDPRRTIVYNHLNPPAERAGEGWRWKHSLIVPSATLQTGDAKHETALVAAGCFWGVEEIFRKIPGVVKTTVGYTGGTTANPTYEEVCTGRTGHAEAIEVVYDPAKVDYATILDLFFRLHDPTTLNRQHNDVGTQYRSAIFYTSEAQKEIAERVKTEQAGNFKKPIVTEISAASIFYSAEDYHQDYLVKNPGGYNCHVLRN
jgi:methionine-S-sulfoxide reductase